MLTFIYRFIEGYLKNICEQRNNIYFSIANTKNHLCLNFLMFLVLAVIFVVS